MEFKFRAGDDRPPMYFSPSSSFGSFYEQALRASYPNADPRRNPRMTRNEIIQREIEKERIREEIIAEEIARRRELEAEVRRELMMEREMAMRGGGGGGALGRVSFEERVAMRLQSQQPMPPVQFMNQFDWLDERLAFHSRGMFNMLPRLPEALPAPEIKPATENNRDKLIVLAKPDPNLCGAKRKAATPPAGDAGGLPFAGIKKKPKEEWSCALCQVSATSERGLNEHLQGRKHKAKEAGLRAQKMAKNPNKASRPKKTAKRAKVSTNTAGLELEHKADGESLQLNKTDDRSDRKTDSKGEIKDKNNVLDVKTEKKVDHCSAATLQIKERTPELRRKRKFKFRCEMCQIGAYSEVVMEAHRKGKKHLSRLQEVNKNSEAISAVTTLATSRASEKAENSEVPEEAKMEAIEIVTNNEKIVTNNKKPESVAAEESGVNEKAEDSEVVAQGATVGTAEIVADNEKIFTNNKKAETAAIDADDAGTEAVAADSSMSEANEMVIDSESIAEAANMETTEIVTNNENVVINNKVAETAAVAADAAMSEASEKVEDSEVLARVANMETIETVTNNEKIVMNNNKEEETADETGAEAISADAAISEASEKAEDSEVVAKEANMVTTETVANNEIVASNKKTAESMSTEESCGETRAADADESNE